MKYTREFTKPFFLEINLFSIDMKFSKLVLIFLTVLIAASCSKYQDGPFLSFRKKSKRLAGTYKMTAIVYIDQNISVTENLPQTIFTYTEDGKYYSSAGDTGTWEFGDGVDLNIKSKVNGVDSSWTVEIMRLANKDLWLRSSQEEWHFEE